jgi:hypothetical protein
MAASVFSQALVFTPLLLIPVGNAIVSDPQTGHPAMKSVTPKIPAQIVRSRGIGALVGTLIGAGWMAYGIPGFPNMIAGLLGLMGLAATSPCSSARAG